MAISCDVVRLSASIFSFSLATVAGGSTPAESLTQPARPLACGCGTSRIVVGVDDGGSVLEQKIRRATRTRNRAWHWRIAALQSRGVKGEV